MADSVNVALDSFGYPGRTREEVRSFVGNGIRKLIERSVPSGTAEEMIPKVHEVFTTHYQKHCADKTKPYDGILELLLQMKKQGVKTAVVSNKADYAVKALCLQYFPELLDVAVGEREGIARKPAPDTVNEVLHVLGAEKTGAVYIGDSDVDVETAQNAGMDCIAVDWGFRTKKVLVQAGAKVIISKPEELMKYVLAES